MANLGPQEARQGTFGSFSILVLMSIGMEGGFFMITVGSLEILTLPSKSFNLSTESIMQRDMAALYSKRPSTRFLYTCLKSYPYQSQQLPTKLLTN